MTPQEKQLLESLTNRIAGTQISQKDPEADALIRQTIGTKPDALYILTQTVLIQEMALNQANQRLHELQQQIDAQNAHANPTNFLPDPPQHQSFLGRLFGPTASRQQAPPPSPPPVAYYQEAPQYYPAPPSGMGDFLRSAAVTATGVAAGALAFEGIESLIGGGHGGFGGGFGGPGWGGPGWGGPGWGGGGEILQGAPQETIINNYYDEPRGGDREQPADYGQDNSSRNDDHADDSNVQDTDYSDANGGNDFSDSSVDV